MKQGRRSSFAKRAAVDDAKIKRNEHGGIAVDEAELKAALSFSMSVARKDYSLRSEEQARGIL